MRRWVWTMTVGGLLACLGTPAHARTHEEPFLGVVIPQEEVDVSSRVDSRLERLEVEVGESVHAGQVLARLDTRAPRQELAAAEAALEGSRAEGRAAALALSEAHARRVRYFTPRSLALGVYSQEELDTVRYAESDAHSRLRVAQARTLERRAQASELRQHLDDATLVAPFSGVVASKLSGPGARLAAGQPVLRLLDTRGWKVRFAVPEDAARQLRPGSPVEVKVLQGAHSLGGTVESIAPEVDAAARLVFALAAFSSPPPADVSAGMVVNVRPVLEQASAGGGP
ncbi:efflux RND transporter periplasmic adaptor subunit [Melittangium boletus]|uniref:Hemolysin D n=1 Tax=Melittangium boletus DSM 14713 TaxID=1294270 RepID=A0A250IN82_9BACT|nr:efflux RND transporter periplasmic adaptor subunit [Melittangium boletus]ATB32682.1 hemolysin D [Melittangium boletus DSM 14713]